MHWSYVFLALTHRYVIHGYFCDMTDILHDKPLTTGPWFDIKMSSYQYRKSHCGDKTILRPSYLHNGISYTGKMTSLYWIRAQGAVSIRKTVLPGMAIPMFKIRRPSGRLIFNSPYVDKMVFILRRGPGYFCIHLQQRQRKLLGLPLQLERQYLCPITFYVFPPHWHNTGSWNPSFCKTRKCLFYINNIMAADDLATQGARASATMLLTAWTELIRSPHVKG